MKVSDAPPAGWYPDPLGGARLRWWEGTDWSDRYRARPPEMRAVPAGQMSMGGWPIEVAPGTPGHRNVQVPPVPTIAPGQVDSAQLVEQVRLAARQEAQRASEMFGQQARAATRNVVPLITEYTTKIGRVLRAMSIVAILLLVLYVAFQIWAQDSLFDWIGDRIDNLTDDSAAIALRPFTQRR